MKNFTDYEALKRGVAAICSATLDDGTTHVEVMRDLLIKHLDFPDDCALVYAQTVVGYHNPDSADCLASNALKLSGHWLGMDQSTTLSGYMESTSYKWYLRLDLTFEYRREYYRAYSSPFGSRSNANSSDGFAGLWAPSDMAGNQFQIVTIDISKKEAKKNWVRWLDQKGAMPRSCQINGRDFARQ